MDCNGEFSLARLRTGEMAELVRLEQGCGMRRRLLDMGLTPGARIECVGVSPGGDPRAFLVRGAVLALIGSSGGGKTTLLRCLNFLETADAGQIYVAGA